MESKELAIHLMQMEPDVRDWCMQLLISYQMGKSSSSVLDSGSARHLQSTVCVTDSDTLTPLSGFDGSVQWTEGNGYVPTEMVDEITGTSFKIDVNDVDLMTSRLVNDIWSMGEMLHDGWKFILNGNENYAISPGGAHRVKVEIGVDNILRIQQNAKID